MPEYTKKGADYSRQFAGAVFARLGAQDHTHYDPSDFGYVAYEGRGYAIRGGNHLAGTHIMGATKANSVVARTSAAGTTKTSTSWVAAVCRSSVQPMSP